MLTELFYWLLNASILGSIAGLIVLLLRKVKALPRFGVYILWFIPLVRLWLPFGFSNKYSLLSLISQFTTKTVVIRESVPMITASNCIMAAKSYFPIEYKNDLLESLFSTASILWVILCCAGLLTSFLLYFLTKSELRQAKRKKENIYTSDRITAPAVYGILHSKIILPAAIADGDTALIVAICVILLSNAAV